jgi:hypothetical protein
MAKMFAFKVENDQGVMVTKTETLSWIKDNIKRSLADRRHKSSSFLVRQTGDNSVEAYDKAGNTITYHYGGFDGCEGLEPYSHDNWPKA